MKIKTGYTYKNSMGILIKIVRNSKGTYYGHDGSWYDENGNSNISVGEKLAKVGNVHVCDNSCITHGPCAGKRC